MKEIFKVGTMATFFIVVLLAVGFAGEVFGLYTLPFRENLRREGFEHSRPVIEGHIEEMGKLIADYNRLQGEIEKHPDSQGLISANKTLQRADVQLIWLHYDGIPYDVQDEVPMDIQEFLANHPRGGE